MISDGCFHIQLIPWRSKLITVLTTPYAGSLLTHVPIKYSGDQFRSVFEITDPLICILRINCDCSLKTANCDSVVHIQQSIQPGECYHVDNHENVAVDPWYRVWLKEWIFKYWSTEDDPLKSAELVLFLNVQEPDKHPCDIFWRLRRIKYSVVSIDWSQENQFNKPEDVRNVTVLKDALKIYSVICCHCVGSVKYKAK